MILKIAWGITGCGDHLAGSVKMMAKLRRKHGLSVDVILSEAGKLVIEQYKLLDTLKKEFSNVFFEIDANTPFLVGPLQLGKYGFFLVCPATANTTAKIANGIADSLLTNCVAQAIKAGVWVYIFPVDQKLGYVRTILPSGKGLRLAIREVDVANAEKLKRMKGITVLSSLNDVESLLLSLINRKGRGNAD